MTLDTFKTAVNTHFFQFSFQIDFYSCFIIIFIIIITIIIFIVIIINLFTSFNYRQLLALLCVGSYYVVYREYCRYF